MRLVWCQTGSKLADTRRRFCNLRSHDNRPRHLSKPLPRPAEAEVQSRQDECRKCDQTEQSLKQLLLRFSFLFCRRRSNKPASLFSKPMKKKVQHPAIRRKNSHPCQKRKEPGTNSIAARTSRVVPVRRVARALTLFGSGISTVRIA